MILLDSLYNLTEIKLFTSYFYQRTYYTQNMMPYFEFFPIPDQYDEIIIYLMSNKFAGCLTQ